MYGVSRRPLTFGLDFDDTVTRNPDLFKEIIAVIIKYGAEVYITTARDKSMWCEQLSKFVEETNITVIFTSTKAKQDVAEVDIWIDDFPLAITHDFKETGWTPSSSITPYIKGE